MRLAWWRRAAAGLAAVGGLAGGLVVVCAIAICVRAEAAIRVAAPSRTTGRIFLMVPP